MGAGQAGPPPHGRDDPSGRDTTPEARAGHQACGKADTSGRRARSALRGDNSRSSLRGAAGAGWLRPAPHEITRGPRAARRGAEGGSTPVVAPLRGVELRFPWKPEAARRNRPSFHGNMRTGVAVAIGGEAPRRLSGWPRASAGIRAGSLRRGRRRGRLCRPRTGARICATRALWPSVRNRRQCVSK